jgi:hypothetical protein
MWLERDRLKESDPNGSYYFDDILPKVIEEARKYFGNSHFPFDEIASGSIMANSINSLPKITLSTALGIPSIRPLRNDSIAHEWTVGPGKRLFIAFRDRAREII